MKKTFLLIAAFCCLALTTFADIVPGKEYTVKVKGKDLNMPVNSAEYSCDFTIHVVFSQAYLDHDPNNWAFLAKYWIDSAYGLVTIPAAGNINVTVNGFAGFNYTINLPLVVGGQVHGVNYWAPYAGYATNKVDYVTINSYPTSYPPHTGCFSGSGTLISYYELMSGYTIDTFVQPTP